MTDYAVIFVDRDIAPEFIRRCLAVAFDPDDVHVTTTHAMHDVDRPDVPTFGVVVHTYIADAVVGTTVVAGEPYPEPDDLGPDDALVPADTDVDDTEESPVDGDTPTPKRRGRPPKNRAPEQE